MGIRRTNPVYGTEEPTTPSRTITRASAGGDSPFAVVPPSWMQQTTTSAMANPALTAGRVPYVTPRPGAIQPALTRMPWQMVRPWSGQVGQATRAPLGLPQGTAPGPGAWGSRMTSAVNRYKPNVGPLTQNPWYKQDWMPGRETLQQWREWLRQNTGNAPAALPGTVAFGAGEAVASSIPAVGTAALLGYGAYDQIAGQSAAQYDLQRQLPGFSSVPSTPGGDKPTTSQNVPVPGYGNQAVTTPDYSGIRGIDWSFLEDVDWGGGLDFGEVPENVGAPGSTYSPVDYGDGWSDPLGGLDRIGMTTSPTGPVGPVGPGPAEPGIHKPEIDFDFSQYDALREKSLADSLAAINAQYTAEGAGYDAEMASIGNEYNRLMDENTLAKRQGLREVNASGAARGLLHSGVYAQGMAELMSGAAADKARIIGAYSTEEGSYGTQARDVESRRKLGVQTQASDIAAVENMAVKEKLDLEQMQALLQAGYSG